MQNNSMIWKKRETAHRQHKKAENKILLHLVCMCLSGVCFVFIPVKKESKRQTNPTLLTAVHWHEKKTHRNTPMHKCRHKKAKNKNLTEENTGSNLNSASIHCIYRSKSFARVHGIFFDYFSVCFISLLSFFFVS